tara:strand:+ start:4151 stop:4876 length:726 start_codon:yes stop_codon:yes gene_type:complete
MGFIDDFKVDQELQVKTLCVAFFLVIFPLYFFSVAAGTDSPTGMGGVGSYEVSGEITYIDFDEGGEYIADGTSLIIDLNTDSLSDMEQEMNIVGVLVSMTYDEDEQARPGPLCLSQTAPDTITGTASHLNFSNSADGQNGGGNTGHDASTEWYNASMIGTSENPEVVEGLSESSIVDQLDAKGAGLGDYSIEISVSAAGDSCTNPLGGQNEDNGEDVSYTIQLIVLDYSITPYIDVDDIDL